MNISKKVLMSVLMALTSLVAMAQPYYHIMKQDGSKMTEEAMFDGQTYKIKIDMVEPEVKTEARPECAIGNKITVTSGSSYPYKTRSFYFTNKGNVYYNDSDNKYYFEKSQLDYSAYNTSNHRCYFGWAAPVAYEFKERYVKEEDFAFTNPTNLRKDLGNEKWTVLNAWEWEYVCKNLGESGWTVDGKRCFLIDTTPGKSLLRTIEIKNGGKTMSREDFFEYEAQGLVCLPPAGCRQPYYCSDISYWSHVDEFLDTGGFYWSCTPKDTGYAYYVMFYFGYFAMSYMSRNEGFAVRLVVLAD